MSLQRQRGRAYEPIFMQQLRVVHPRCGSLAVVTDYNVHSGLIIAICPGCDKYVYLKLNGGRKVLEGGKRAQSQRGAAHRADHS